MSERERLVSPNPEIVEGEDELPRRPADLDDPVEGRDPLLSPVLPPPRYRNLLYWAWIPILIAIGVIVWAALR
jgi:hypothetical protein